MPTDDPIRSDARAASRDRRLGQGTICWGCGETDPRVLVLHWHHPTGRKHAPDLQVRLCMNCHARQHADLQDTGVDLEHHTTVLIERLPEILAGNGRYLVAVGELLVELAHRLTRFLVALDRQHPGWRQLPEANLD